MNRRHFLLDTAALAGAGLLALPGRGAARPADAARFTLARFDRTRDAFVPVRQCAADRCGEAELRLCFLAFHPAEPAPVLQALRVQALFDVDGAPQAPYLVWDYRADDAAGNSRGVSFVAARERLRDLAVDYRLRGAAGTSRAHLPLTDLAEPLLAPGDYVLAGPAADGRAAALGGLRHGGDPARPLRAPDGRAPAFDYLAFRIEPLA